ncbi:MAG: hypothetical protein NTZ10_01205 [Candidatus Saganbacteria bacterium]|nr:hypothetical protein [Candidatus Saganbacteria bacterium]
MKRNLFISLLLLCLICPSAIAEGKSLSFGIGIPHFVSGYYLMKAGRGLELGYGAGGLYIPPMKQACGADVMINGLNIEAMLRKYIISDLFAGARVGYQIFTAHSIQEVNPPFYDSTIGLRGFYLTPSIGYNFRLKGFSIIPEVGVQIPLAFEKYETKVGPGDLEPSVKQVVNDNINRMNAAMPFIQINFGFAF